MVLARKEDGKLTLSGRSAGFPAVHLCTSGRRAVFPAECR